MMQESREQRLRKVFAVRSSTCCVQCVAVLLSSCERRLRKMFTMPISACRLQCVAGLLPSTLKLGCRVQESCKQRRIVAEDCSGGNPRAALEGRRAQHEREIGLDCAHLSFMEPTIYTMTNLGVGCTRIMANRLLQNDRYSWGYAI